MPQLAFLSCKRSGLFLQQLFRLLFLSPEYSLELCASSGTDNLSNIVDNLLLVLAETRDYNPCSLSDDLFEFCYLLGVVSEFTFRESPLIVIV